MSIAKKMLWQVEVLRSLCARENGDLQAGLPNILESLSAEIERVAELENHFVFEDKQAGCVREGM